MMICKWGACMDRFSYGLPDMQEKPAAVVGNCEHCTAEIFLGDEIIEYSDELYCDYKCLMERIGAREVCAGLED